MHAEIQSYLEEVQNSISQVNVAQIHTMTEVLFQAFLRGQTVFTMGNGASAALAAHMVCDLGKGTATDIGQGTGSLADPRLRIVSLTDNVTLMTAYGNDVDYQDVFLEQLKGLLRSGDVVLGISGSGDSPNVLRALEYARTMGCWTLGMIGSQPGAGLISALCDTCLRAPSTKMEQIEDLHVMFSHAIAVALRRKIAEHNTSRDETVHPQIPSAMLGMTVAAGENGRTTEQALCPWDATGDN